MSLAAGSSPCSQVSQHWAQELPAGDLRQAPLLRTELRPPWAWAGEADGDLRLAGPRTVLGSNSQTSIQAGGLGGDHRPGTQTQRPSPQTEEQAWTTPPPLLSCPASTMGTRPRKHDWRRSGPCTSDSGGRPWLGAAQRQGFLPCKEPISCDPAPGTGCWSWCPGLVRHAHADVRTSRCCCPPDHSASPCAQGSAEGVLCCSCLLLLPHSRAFSDRPGLPQAGRGSQSSAAPSP